MKSGIHISQLLGISLLMSLFSCSSVSDNSLVAMIEIKDHWKFSESEKDEWMEAEVPGCVHTDLIRNGVIEDPFYRLNEHDVQWIDKKDWIYETELKIPSRMMVKDRVILEFKGLDTHADVYLNDQKILVADNMFRDWTVDIKEYLATDSNTLKIHFHSPIKTGLEKYDNYPHRVESSGNDLAEIGQVPEGKKVSPHIRKAQCHFGWDWGPRLVTSGIWQPVYLKAWDEARITDLRIVQNRLEDDKAELTACFEIESEVNTTMNLEIQVNDKEVTSAPVEIGTGVHEYEVGFEIEQPSRWWTNGLGEAYMYRIAGVLRSESGLQKVEHNIGLRTLEVVREKDDSGTSLYFKLNGHPVFMKGANYIPSDAFLDRVSPEKYEKLILTAKDCNYNMLRVWGGGIYEKDIFYDLCDKHGILVWQDFMFACNMYPGHPEFLESVGKEAAYNIRRLRNHPSIALWCGNNEILSAWWLWGWKERIEKEDPAGAIAQWKAYKDIFLDVLPSEVEKHDPDRFYWASSPQSGDTIPEDLVGGDSHYWGVWWGKEPFSRYHTWLARFMSEYGFQSFPGLNTVKKYTIEEDWDIYSDVMKSHQRSSIGNETIETYLLRDYKKPKDFESYLYLSHVLQAEGVKMAMEGHRIAKPYTMGSLYWQINDCWPVASWSSTDYYVQWKALQYYSKKAFADVLVASRVEEEILKVHVVSDKLDPLDATLALRMVDFKGETLWTTEEQIEIRANSSDAYFAIPVEQLLENLNAGEVLLEAKLVEQDREIASSNFFFIPIKDIDLPQPEVKMVPEKVEDGFNLELSTDLLAKNVYLSMDEEGFFSDNYFDLLPGEKRTIHLKTDPSTSDPADRIRIMTIRDTY
ncbi:MAG: glycoside hydrolase family 2 protein [Bacteroidales bacterium]|nr:glycoside hydrolase family 2 protein [Bacteroidales bacterium]